jgi:hypothetical protein
MRVSMGGELLSDLIGEHVDLLDQSLEGGHQGASDVEVWRPLIAGRRRAVRRSDGRAWWPGRCGLGNPSTPAMR